MADPSTVIGALGVGLLLGAFFLNVGGWLKAERAPYLVLNAVGGGLACYASWLIPFWPFVVLEATWTAVALVGLGRALARRSPQG